MSFATNGTVGIQLDSTPTYAEYNLGDKMIMNDSVYQYVLSTAAIAQYAMVKITATFTAAEGTTTLLPTTEPAKVGIAQTAFASGDYGWVFVGPGIARCKFAASCVQNVKIYTTATAGVVDDAATTLVEGLKLITTITSATDSPCWAAIELATAIDT